MYDPVDVLLNYILEVRGMLNRTHVHTHTRTEQHSEAEVAIGCDRDIYAIFKVCIDTELGYATRRDRS